MKTTTLPNRAKSGVKFTAILIMYTLILTMIFITWQSSGFGPISIGLAIGCFIGVMRETSMRMKYKKALKAGDL